MCGKSNMGLRRGLIPYCMGYHLHLDKHVWQVWGTPDDAPSCAASWSLSTSHCGVIHEKRAAGSNRTTRTSSAPGTKVEEGAGGIPVHARQGVQHLWPRYDGALHATRTISESRASGTRLRRPWKMPSIRTVATVVHVLSCTRSVSQGDQ
jgi:hypothetical protein